MSGFRQLDEHEIAPGTVVSFRRGTFAAPGGEVFERDIVRHPGAVSAVPLLEDGRVVFVRQFRAAIGIDLLEIPAGKRDAPGEPPEQTVARELVEEVGLRAGRLELLAEFHNSPGFSDEHSYVYLATELTPAPIDRQGVEELAMVVEEIPFDEALAMIPAGQITDAKTIIGLTLAARHLGR